MSSLDENVRRESRTVATTIMTDTTATAATTKDPATVARNGVEAKVDGVILPPIINTKVIFDEEKRRYVEIDGKLPYVIRTLLRLSVL